MNEYDADCYVQAKYGTYQKDANGDTVGKELYFGPYSSGKAREMCAQLAASVDRSLAHSWSFAYKSLSDIKEYAKSIVVQQHDQDDLSVSKLEKLVQTKTQQLLEEMRPIQLESAEEACDKLLALL